MQHAVDPAHADRQKRHDRSQPEERVHLRQESFHDVHGLRQLRQQHDRSHY